MNKETKEVIIDFLEDVCGGNIITLYQYKVLIGILNLQDEPTAEDIADDHIQQEVEDWKEEQVKGGIEEFNQNYNDN